MSKEKAKTVFLALLFILSVLLTQKLWIIIPSGETTSVETEASGEEELNIYDEILSPQSYIYNFGGGYHTVLFTDSNGTWDEVVGIVDKFVEKKFTFETLSEEQWQEANEYKSVNLKFSFPVPLELFYSGYEDWGLGDAFTHIENVLVPAAEPDSLYVADKSQGIYLKLKGEETGREIASKIEDVEKSAHTDYFKTGDILGIDSDMLLPITFEGEIPSIEVTSQIEISDKTQITGIAGRIFGETFDFVKKIEEVDGSVVYISNYGEKVLRIQSDGLMEYTEKLEKQGQPAEMDRLKLLGKAVGFVKNNGGWPGNAYLADIGEVEKAGVPGCRFLFDYKMKGYSVLDGAGENNSAITVEVYGNTVAYYKRRVVREKMEMQEPQGIDSKTVLVPQKVIDRNIKEIAAAYIIDNDMEIEGITKDQLLFRILSAMDDIGLAYYIVDDDDREMLNPVWRIAIEKRLYYFNVRNGKILYRSKTDRRD